MSENVVERLKATRLSKPRHANRDDDTSAKQPKPPRQLELIALQDGWVAGITIGNRGCLDSLWSGGKTYDENKIRYELAIEKLQNCFFNDHLKNINSFLKPALRMSFQLYFPSPLPCGKITELP